MKKLLSILTISTLTASVPAPLLANTPLTRAKRDVEVAEKDVTTGFDVKIKEKYGKEIYVSIDPSTQPFKNITDNKWYIVILSSRGKIKKLLNDNNEKTKKTILEPDYKVYRWDGVDEPQTPEIDTSGNITDWKQPEKNDFKQGISFSLVDGSKTATWSNAGVRLTVDGETNININNSNVTEILWNGEKQKMLDHKVKINVKPETSEKTHKLVIKYDMNGTKYSSEDIDVVMAAKIDPTPIPTAKQLNVLITNTDLDNIIDKDDDTIKVKIIEKNSLAIDFSQVEITDKTDTQATLTAKSGSKSYQGSVDVKYNVVPATTVDLKIDLTSSASGVQIDSDYLAQLDKSKMTNKVDTFYYANGKSTITIKKPPTGNVITGKAYGCDEKWNKTLRSSNIDPVSGLEIDKGQYGSVDKRYLIELQHSTSPTHTKNIYLQVSEKQKVEH